MARRIISLFIVLCMTVGVLPLAAFAQEASHTHPICGSSCTEGHSIQEWTGVVRSELSSIIGSVTKVDGVSYYLMNSGSYYLSENISLPYDLRVPDGAVVNLCLNGKLLAGTGEGSVITVEEGGVLNLTDCRTDVVTEGKMSSGNWIPYEGGNVTLQGGVIYDGFADYGGGIYNSGLVTMYGGNIAGNEGSAPSADPHAGGGVANYGSFYLYGGTITGNQSRTTVSNSSTTIYVGIGGGVYNKGDFTMYGGAIRKNDGYHNGGAVYNVGNFTLGGGSIDNNTAVYGAGIVNTSAATLVVAGGSISNNDADYEGAAISNSGTVIVTGGSICDNKISGYGGNFAYNGSGAGIYQEKGSTTISGGEIRGNYISTNGTAAGAGINIRTGSLTLTGGIITENYVVSSSTKEAPNGGGIYLSKNAVVQVSGDIQVTGNTGSGTANNIYVPVAGQITVGTDLDLDGNMEYLSENALLGITPGILPTEDVPFDITVAASSDYSGSFRSDNPLYEAVNSGSDDAQVVQLILHTTCVEGEPVTENRVEPGCTTEGSYDMVVYCATCGMELSRETVPVSPVGHSFTNYVSNGDATCIAEGTKTAKCDRCEATDTVADAGSVGDHAYETVSADPTCTAPGGLVHTCKLCGHSYLSDEIPATGHTMGAWYTVTEASCEEEGLERRDCADCDHSEERAVDALGHDYKAVVTDPVCDTEGYTTHTCERCGDSYTDGTVAAIGHSYVNGFCTVCDGYEQAADLDGDGVWEISNAGQLYWFAQLVNGGQTDACAILKQNIQVNEAVLTADGSLNDGTYREWTPIGSQTAPFIGNFDGNNLEISGLYLEGGSYIGLFGYTDTDSVLQNINLKDCWFSGASYVGTLAGYVNKAAVSNCTNAGTVQATGTYAGGLIGYVDYSTVDSCHNSGTVTGSGSSAGGIAGVIRHSKTTYCTNSGSITAKPEQAGGIAGGGIGGSISNCHNSGAILSYSRYSGGIVGAASTQIKISLCSNSGRITGKYTNHTYSGGIAGGNEGTSTITNCYNTGYVGGYINIGGITGYNALNCKVQHSYNTGNIGGSHNRGAIIGNNDGYKDISTCYYLKGSATRGTGLFVGSSYQDATVMTSEQFASGEVAYLLQSVQSTQVWGQNLDNGEEVQLLPVFSDARVYLVRTGGCTDENAVYGYSNYNTDRVVHSFGDWETVVEATCTEPGSEKRACECGETETRETEELGHDWHDATCTVPKTCGRCGETEGEALGHSFTDYVSNGDATCTKDGTKTAKCDRCDETDTVTDEGSMIPHSYESVITPPTCTENGYTTHTCIVCGDTYMDSHSDALGHDWEEWKTTKDATCTADGEKRRECSACDHYETEVIKAAGHKLGEWKTVKDATCTADGEKRRECSACDHYETEVIKATGHKYEDGKCTVCGEADPDYVPPTTDPEPTPETDSVVRLAGADRFDTAFKAANELKTILDVEKFDSVVVASGAEFADALAGSYLAAVKEAPILLSYKAKQNEQVQAYIKANLAPGGTVYILGGTSAVPASMETGLQGLNVKRLAGADRFETNLLILKEAGVKAGDEILVCTGKEFADSLSASATGKPILLVYKKLTDGQKAYLSSLKGNKFCIVGGESAVPTALETAIKAYGETTRLAGKDRLVTSVMVAQKYFSNPEAAVVAYGWNYPDGLCGGPLAYAMDAPLILTYSKPSLYATAVNYTNPLGIKSGYILGGEGLVYDEAVRAIFSMAAADVITLK